MIAVVTRVYNPLNFDVVFPYDDVSNNGAKSTETIQLSLYDKEQNTFHDPVVYDVYRVRLRGLSRRDLQFKDGTQKHRLLLRLNRSSCVVRLTINSIDRYGRIEADVQDPVQNFSYAKWLLEKYPDVYYRYRTWSR